MAEEEEYIVYNFKWKEKNGSWETKEVIGHRYYQETNRMVLFKPDGGIFEVPNWNDHYSDLGKDWADKVKKQQAEELAEETQDKGQPHELKGNN